jgi:predicted 3-demethylubiquinone-9 3-methyltransferase (glyoxalase superfamily)
MRPISPCLWFDDQAEEAVNFYCSIFKNSKIGNVSRYKKEGQEIHGKEPGSFMAAEFEINGQPFMALNGGPMFKLTEAVSFQIHCETQEEVDYYWDKLSVGGDPNAQQCGWLKDQFGLSWQVVPTLLPELINSKDAAKSGAAMNAMLQMQKLDIKALQQAYDKG